MAEQSQLSYYSGVSEVSQFGGSQLSSISHGDDRDSSPWQTGLLACFCACFLLVCSGIVVAFVMGNAYDDESDEFGKTDDGKYRPPVVIGSGPVVIRSGSAVTTTDRTRTLRPLPHGMVICVVGESLVSPTGIPATLCDYVIYPELVKSGSDFTPQYGVTSWEAFKNATALGSSLRFGLSFSAHKPLDSNSTVAYIPHALPQLETLVRTMRVSAMGVLDFLRDDNVRPIALQPMFRTLDTAVAAGNNSDPMIFLGVQLKTNFSVSSFVSQIGSVGYITTIIIQTHAHELPRRVFGCSTFPVSVTDHRLEMPNYEFAELAAQRLRSQGGKFRILFSSTMSVMMFVGALGSGQPVHHFAPCERTSMVDYDTICNIPAGNQSYYDPENAEYKIWELNNRHYYATYESERSLTLRMNRYAANSSEGWAVFEVQRDTARGCNISSHHRVELIRATTGRLRP